jgi:hypothetical protein
MALNWFPLSMVPSPHLQDVGAMIVTADPASSSLDSWFIGSDGSFWVFGTSSWQQKPSPGDLSRVAVSSDGYAYTVNRRGQLWRFKDTWVQIDLQGDKAVDVSVGLDSRLWVVMENGSPWVAPSAGANPVFSGAGILLSSIAAATGPDGQNPFGLAWGVTPVMFGPFALCKCEGGTGWSGTTLTGIRDLAVSTSKQLFLVRDDGTVWITGEGILQVRAGNQTGFTRISASPTPGIMCAVKADGSAWIWADRNEPPHPPPPLPTMPPARPSGGQPPVITARSTGAGESTVFLVSGRRFAPDREVTLRATRLADGQVFQFFWIGRSDVEGKAEFSVPLPCLSGLVINFSANDGRSNPADLTNRLWSNTVSIACP